MLMTQTLTDQQCDILTLWYQVNASLSAYAKLISSFGSATAALSASLEQWQQLALHPSHLSRYQKRAKADHAVNCVEKALADGHYQLIFFGDSHYPAMLTQLYDPPPLLFCRGEVSRLQQAQIAIVGSRRPTTHAQKITFDLAQYLAQAGYVITSGLAMGVDKQAHLGALTLPVQAETASAFKGHTLGVMGTGIDVHYPRHHDQLFERILSQGGCIISELLPGTQANKHTFPRRNRLVAGLSIATIVTEAALKSGSLITARLASEQGKQVFAIPSHIDNSNAEGCHHLIREGATLVYHPDQVIEDVQKQSEVTKRAEVNNANDSRLDVWQQLPRSVAHLSQADSHLPQVPLTAKATGVKDGHSAINAANTRNDNPTSAIISELPSHLRAVYECLDWSGQDLDSLLIRLNSSNANQQPLETASLLGQLMELELLGLIAIQGGRYLRL